MQTTVVCLFKLFIYSVSHWQFKFGMIQLVQSVAFWVPFYVAMGIKIVISIWFSHSLHSWVPRCFIEGGLWGILHLPSAARAFSFPRSSVLGNAKQLKQTCARAFKLQLIGATTVGEAAQMLKG
jgi:hypothetical protein